MNKAIAGSLGLVIIIFSFLSCTTTGIAGLAKEDYMVEKFAETDARYEQEMEAYQREIEELRAELQALNQDVEEISGFLQEFESLANSVAGMQELADNVENQLEKMPEATLIRLLEILQAYLGVE